MGALRRIAGPGGTVPFHHVGAQRPEARPVPGDRPARWTEAAATDTPTAKTEDGQDFPAAAYAYTPDPEKPSTWKLRLWETPTLKVTAKQVGSALAALSPGGFRGKKVAVPATALPVVKKKIFAAWKQVHPDDKNIPVTLQGTEALPGGRTFDEMARLIGEALKDNLGDADFYVWVRDMTDEWVAYTIGGDTYRADYTVADDGTVTFGVPAEVEVRTMYDPIPPDADDAPAYVAAGQSVPTGVDALTGGDDAMAMTEASRKEADRISGRVLEAKGTDAVGGRIFGVQIIAYGDSKNSRRYTESVMRAASGLYEGAKAYDHHRTPEELTTSTINGLVGSYRNVEATADGLQADLVLLPSAAHTAEALDASLEAQSAGLPPLVGISHDVMCLYRPVVSGGRRLMEATEILSVNSADVVADPSAGGRATRMVAGGSGGINSPEEDTVTIEELLALINGATPEQRAQALEGLGIDDATMEKLRKTEAAPPPPPAAAPPVAGDTWARESVVGQMVVRSALETAKLPVALAESVTAALPERFSESDVRNGIQGFQRIAEGLERAGLVPRVESVEVTADALDKKMQRLDATFAGDYQKGYRSFKEAYCDITGYVPRFSENLSEDFNRRILRESVDTHGVYDSAVRGTESVTASTWNTVLGDSITRRLVAEYNQPSLAGWRDIVSSIVPVNDFRTQRIERLGGYGVLPAVNEGAPYQALTSPGNEEVTYSINKKGGTEDLTLETIANDDLRAVVRIPTKLGLAAAQTLYRFIFDFLNTNPTLYDSTALFAAGHGSNTATSALGRGAVSTGRKAMRKQTAYGDSNDVLSITPKFLIVCSDLEELAFEITQSENAIPTAAPDGAATNIPNIHRSMTPKTIDYWSSTTTWFLVADPNMVPTIEVGFYRGQQDPELFVQNDPTVGSVFTSDKITWKIRHIYSGAVLDFRGFYRGNT